MTTPIIQALSSNIIHIRSKETNYNNLNSDFNVTLKNAIEISENQEAHINIISAEIPYSFYNISSDLENNVLIFDNTNILTFTNQDYNITELIDFINADTNFNTLFTTTYNTQKNKITFTNKDTVNPHTINFSLSNINKVIGWEEDQSDIVISASGNTESVNVCNLATVHSIMVRSNLSDANTQSSRSGNSTILQKISIDMNSGFLIYLNNSDYRTTSIISATTIDYISIILTNQDDLVLNLNGVNFELTLLVEIFPIDNSPATRRILTVEKDIGAPPTQQNLLQAPQPRLENIDNTHPIEGVSEVEHKGDRIVLDQLLERMSK